MARIAIPVKEKSQDAALDARFARAVYIAVYDTDEDDLEFIENSSTFEHGAGPKMVQFLADRGVKALIVLNIGENALKAARMAGIKVYRADDTSRLQDVLTRFASGTLEEIR